MSVNKSEEATVDAGVEARFAEGNVVGDLAMRLFGDFVEVTTMTEDGKLDLSIGVDPRTLTAPPPQLKLLDPLHFPRYRGTEIPNFGGQYS